MEIDVQTVKAIIGDLVIQKTVLEAKVAELTQLLEESTPEPPESS